MSSIETIEWTIPVYLLESLSMRYFILERLHRLSIDSRVIGWEKQSDEYGRNLTYIFTTENHDRQYIENELKLLSDENLLCH